MQSRFFYKPWQCRKTCKGFKSTIKKNISGCLYELSELKFVKKYQNLSNSVFSFNFPQIFQFLFGKESVDVFEMFDYFLVAEFVYFGY